MIVGRVAGRIGRLELPIELIETGPAANDEFPGLGGESTTGSPLYQMG